MHKSLWPVLLLCLSGLFGCRTAAPAFTKPQDPPLIPLCLAVADGKEPAPVAALSRHPLLHKMATGIGGTASELRFTVDEMARAAASPRPDPRFSWDRLRRNAHFLRGFLARVQGRERELVEAGLRRASEFLYVKPVPTSVVLHFVCGGPWDAYVLTFDRREDKPEIFIDLGWNADREPERAFRDFKAILEHELWHLAFLEQQRRWQRQYRDSSDPAALFMYRLLNEGVGHYYSMRHRLYPAPSWPDFGKRVQQVFALLAERYPRFVATTDAEKRRRQLWGSHAGVPFWEKWGAVPGGLMTYALERKLGKERLRGLLAEEPFSFVLAYRELQRADAAAWPALPTQLVSDAERLLAQHHRVIRSRAGK